MQTLWGNIHKNTVKSISNNKKDRNKQPTEESQSP